MQKAFVLDLNRCTGCDACSIACRIENELPPEMSWRRVVTFNEARLPGMPLFSLSLACHHCIDAPCKAKCPALAYRKDARTGAVTIEPSLCMGCRYCEWVCPYGAPRRSPSKGVMEKCTLCSHRLREGLEPACTLACPTAALGLEDYSKERASEPLDIPGFWKNGIQPAIHFRPLRRGLRPPQMHQAPSDPERLQPSVASARRGRKDRSETSLGGEWPLWVFTLSASLLVALFHSFVLGAFGLRWPLFAATGVGAMAVATLHLGKKGRFYRAVLNWRRSWVSREILLFSVFFAGAVYIVSLAPFEPLLGRAVAALGFAALFAMDKVYQLDTNLSGRGLHSASVLLTGVYLVGVFTRQPYFLFPLALAKLILYLLRAIRGGRRALRLARVLFGFVLPVFMWLLTASTYYALITAAILLGEIIDRAEFYLELDFARPVRQVEADLDKLLAHRPLVLS